MKKATVRQLIKMLEDIAQSDPDAIVECQMWSLDGQMKFQVHGITYSKVRTDFIDHRTGLVEACEMAKTGEVKLLIHLPELIR